MSIVVPEQELQQIIELISQCPDGLGVEELVQRLGSSMPRRTLQRRLAALVKQGRILSGGVGRAIKYRVGAAAGDVVVALKGETSTLSAGKLIAEVYVPTSPEGDEIKAYIRQARQLRKPAPPDFFETGMIANLRSEIQIMDTHK